MLGINTRSIGRSTSMARRRSGRSGRRRVMAACACAPGMSFSFLIGWVSARGWISRLRHCRLSHCRRRNRRPSRPARRLLDRGCQSFLFAGSRVSVHGMWRSLLVLLLLAIWATAEERKPNIVFILADDLGINDLGCYGRKDQSTPVLDKLASEGMRFACAYCAQPICSASRAALLTGKSPARLHLTTFLPGRPDKPSQKLL